MDARFSTFLRAFTSNWFEAMSGGLSVPLMAAGILWPNTPWGIGLGLLGIVALVFVSFKIWQRERRALIAALASSSKPDWPIHDAFFALEPTVIDNIDEEKWEEVGNKLLDLLSTGQIAAWGREIDRFSMRRSALIKIPEKFWQGATFTFWFLKEDDPDAMHVESNSGKGLGPNPICGLAF